MQMKNTKQFLMKNYIIYEHVYNRYTQFKKAMYKRKKAKVAQYKHIKQYILLVYI